MNISSSSAFAKSIIFMDVGDNVVADLDESDCLFRNPIAKDLPNCSFDQPIHEYDHQYKRASLGYEDHGEASNKAQKNTCSNPNQARTKAIDSIANNTSSTDNLSMIIQSDGLKNPGNNLESTKSDSEANFKQLHPSQFEGDCSTNIGNNISKSKTRLKRLNSDRNG